MLEPVPLHSPSGEECLERLVTRRFDVPAELEARVRAILDRVRDEGDQAVLAYTHQFDAPGLRLEDLRVPDEEIRRARSELDPAFLRSLEKAAAHVRAFHRHQLPNSWFTTREDGAVLGQLVRPVDAAGLYVPGGQAGQTPLVSSVLMNALPAAIAGVPRIVLATPPNREGGVHPAILAAAAEAGVHEVYRMGSAWAVAAMAFGTETVAPVDVVVGPGNIYVTLAKRLVAGTVGIDMVAGPSEVLVIADEGAPAAYVAADLLSQAEHDPMATAVLVTPSETLARQAAAALEDQLARLPRAETARRSLADHGLVLVVRDLDEAVEVANRVAPEHLELLTADPWALLPRVRHAGAVFLGPYTPEPVGDYVAGPNHVLPTMGTARFSSALGVETFLKRSSVLAYSAGAFAADARDVVRLAALEGLDAHARSVEVRLEGLGRDAG
ncbi:histidinol dehydrogenase [Dissulfurirhabdus thermomarina]|uniref:Histidinol dehydrogenase n=1 Tax=Dissulfurirhabdus thermomarina TaxID=1765737 RepID=A0A6N9TL03_DISTH|nr:histidinol dehydrogenase [Dissulfurirhabdus thermomarina]NDY41799.1 histidinol dehydrogenase [Dissulfurirhabdus thermomarina]NMX24060.1 histidinol dehydrogenase [Dissulfurirhabdus thermomarina]